MTIPVRYPELTRVESLGSALTGGLEERGSGRTYLEVTANHATVHFAATIIEPQNPVEIMPPATIPEDARPHANERGVGWLDGQQVTVVVNPEGRVFLAHDGGAVLTGGTWVIGKVEYLRSAL